MRSTVGRLNAQKAVEYEYTLAFSLLLPRQASQGPVEFSHLMV
jgi:hypothetical protein